jgi:hypothetical protein
MASSLFTFSIGLPNLIMPMMGGILYDAFGGDVVNEPSFEERQVNI